ncbi:hypothetical protein AB0E96_33235, partial [Kitasatospora sp. NPDC036755]|uniref:hypothetical protein n=1 Tax=Kitasatospora sp. NPDC036755 TaxID=3154600 RepID=UPI0033C742AF
MTTPAPGPRTGEPARAKPVGLSFLTPDGRRSRAWARFGPDYGPPSRGPVRTRNALLNNGVKCVQVRAVGPGDPAVGVGAGVVVNQDVRVTRGGEALVDG